MSVQYDTPSLNGITINTSKNDGTGSLAADFSIIAHDIDATSNGSSSSGGSSSSSNAIIQQGTYTGNSTSNNAEQIINLGFTPIRVEIFGKNDYKSHAILLKDKTDNLVSWRAIDGSHDDHRSYSDKSIIVENGFKISNGAPANASHLNYNDVEFDYYVTAEADGGSSSGGFLSASTISSAITDDLTENNMGITLPENIVVNWGGGDKLLPLISVDNDNIWYGASVGNTKILKSFKNSKTDNDYGESDNWGPVGPSEISDWDKSASLKDYIDAIKTRS
jgi:hypothetical protein